MIKNSLTTITEEDVAYKTPTERVGLLIEKYRQLYGLPIFGRKEDIDYKFLLQAKRGTVFVVVVVHNREREFLLVRNFSRGTGWELIGGFIKDEVFERPEQAVVRIVKKECGLNVIEMTPIAIVRNVFSCGKENVTHLGIAYTAECDGILSFENNLSGDFSSAVPQQMLASDKEVFLLARVRTKNKLGAVPIQEIDSVHNFRFAIRFHERVVSPITHLFSSAIIDKVILKIVGRPLSFLDVAVGDDDLILKIYRQCRPVICVANDIAFTATNLLRSVAKLDEEIIFTNHDTLNMPFTLKFNVVLCKNTLHHMTSHEEIKELLNSLRKVSKRLVIVDVDNPRHSTLRSRVWNWYYRKFLGDQGGYFLNYQQFTDVIKNFFVDSKCRFRTISTIKGNYMVAVIEVGQK